MTADVALWPTVYARAVLGEPAEQLVDDEPPNRLGPPVVVRCMSCPPGPDSRPRPVVDCTCWGDWAPGSAS